MPVIGKRPEDKICPKCHKEWDSYHEMEAKLMPIITTDSSLSLIIGAKGKGKTFCSMWLACVLTKFPHYDWHVISNVVFGKFKGMKAGQSQDDPEAIADFERAEPPSKKMHFANTLVDVFRIESELLLESYNRGRRIHVMLIIDEGPLAVGGQATQSIYDPKTRALYKLLTLTRKIRTSITIITLHERLLAAKLRTDEDVGGIGLVRVVFSKYLRKPPNSDMHGILDIVEKSRREIEPAGEYEYAYDITGIPYNQLVTVEVVDDRTILPSLLHVGTSDFTKPINMLKVGEITYDTYSIAGFTLGDIGGKPFHLDDLIHKISDVHSSDIPELLYRYFHRDEELPQVSDKEMQEMQEESEEISEEEYEETKRQFESDEDITPQLLALQKEIKMDKEFMKKTGRPLHPTLASLYRRAGVSEKQFHRLKHRLDLNYRTETKGDDKDEETNT